MNSSFDCIIVVLCLDCKYCTTLIDFCVLPPNAIVQKGVLVVVPANIRPRPVILLLKTS